MKKSTIQVRAHVGDSGAIVPASHVDRWVCNRSHPHPTAAGAEACEAARAAGADDAQLYALFDAEVIAFNAAEG